MKVDPARWSERSQGIGMLAVIALYLAAIAGSFFGLGREPIVRGWLVVSFGTLGALYWRALGIPWRDIASWTIPLTVWMAASAVAPPVPWGFLVWVAGSLWFSLFLVGTPLTPWWYRSVLRKPVPSVFMEDGPDDDLPKTG